MQNSLSVSVSVSVCVSEPELTLLWSCVLPQCQLALLGLHASMAANSSLFHLEQQTSAWQQAYTAAYSAQQIYCTTQTCLFTGVKMLHSGCRCHSMQERLADLTQRLSDTACEVSGMHLLQVQHAVTPSTVLWVT